MTRWKKVYRDLWNNRSRTLLVALSIAIGVFAFGMIASTQQVLTTSLAAQYAAIRPADAILTTEAGLDDDFITGIRHLRGVNEAEGRRSLPLRLSLDGAGETWRDITLYSLADPEEQHLNLVSTPQDTLAKGEVLLERASMDYIGAQSGDPLLVKTPDGRKFHLTITGVAHDLYRIPPFMEGWVYGYIDSDTLRWMGESEGYNELYIDVISNDPEDIKAISEKASDRIKGSGLPVYHKNLPNPGEHPMAFIIDTVLLLLGLVGLLSLLLSALLVTNVISALIAQQERQIALMKAVGARTGQITGLYFVLVFAIGILACLVAIPCSYLGARALTDFVAELVNFDAPQATFTLPTLVIQLAVGLLLPMLAAAPSILKGARVLPAAVLSEYGINQVWSGAGLLDVAINRIPKLTRATLLALRNPFRKRSRLVLSLVTLTFAGAVFMGVINLQASLGMVLNDMFGFWRYDAWLVTDGHAPGERLVNEALAVPGVERAESWGFSLARMVLPDDSESGDLYLLAPPAGTDLLQPPIIAGRNLEPGETNSVLVSPGLLAAYPQYNVGSPIVIKIDGREQTYTIAGVMNMIGNSTIGYFTVIDYDAYTRHVREPNRSNAVIMVLGPRDLETQQRILSRVEKRFDRANLDATSSFLISEERVEIDGAFNIVVTLLMVMTVLLAAVGGLGLMGAMSLNVLERTREIGVMRAYGASSRTVFRIVIIEGLLIGLLSWALAIVLALPISSGLTRLVGVSFLDTPMSATFALSGVLAWAALVAVISIVASLVPALRAVHLTVTEVLAYE